MRIRPLALALLFLSFFVLFAQSAQTAENLVQNAAFSDGLTGWGSYVFTGSPTVAVDEQGLRIATSAADRVTVYQWIKNFEPGRTYKFRALVMTEEPLQGQRLSPPGSRCGCFYVRFQFRDADNRQARSNLHSPAVFEASDWTPLELEIDVPANAVSMQMEIFVEHAAGVVRVKEVELVGSEDDSAAAAAVDETRQTAAETGASAPDATAAPAPEVEGNLVVNGAFQDGLSGWKLYRFTGNAAVDVDKDGLRIVSGSNQDRTTVYQSVRGFTPGIPHELRARIKTEGITSGRGAYIRLQFHDENGQRTRGHLETQDIRATNGWFDLVTDVMIPKNTASITLELFMEHAAGTVWFTDVALVEAEIPVVTPVDVTAEVHPLGAVRLAWGLDGREKLSGEEVTYYVYRSLTPGAGGSAVPLAVVSETAFVDRTVRAGRTYYYRIVPVVPAPYQANASETITVNVERVSPGEAPKRFQAIWTEDGVLLSWSFREGARINYIDLYRYVGSEPQDFEEAVKEAAYVGRMPAWRTEYRDTGAAKEDVMRTWYLVRATDPDGQQVGTLAVPLTGVIQRTESRAAEHPRLIVSRQDIEEIRAAAAANPATRFILTSTVLRPADVVAAQWVTPRALPAKDANSEHARLARDARTLGLAYQFEPGKTHYAEAAKNILLTYADRYATYPKTTTYGGRVTHQTLDEATWLIDIAWAYDLIYDHLTPSERQHIADDLLREAAAVIQSSPRGLLNWQVWHNAALAAVGFALGDEGLIDAVLHGELSVLYHLREGLKGDGLWWEQSIAYHDYTLEAFTWLALIAQNGGYDIFGLQVGDRTFRSMYEAPIYHAFADLTQPSVGDSPPTTALGGQWVYGAAFRAYGDPRFAWVLQQGNLMTSQFPSVILSYWLAQGQAEAPRVGSGDFAPAGRNDYGSSLFEETGMALLRGSVASQDGLGAALIYKPQGTFAGHQHADNLSLYLSALGHQWLAGSGRFEYRPGMTDDRHGTFARHTVAKNTLVVDGVSQIPQTRSAGLWNTDDVLTSRGRLELYLPGPTLQLVQATSSEVYPGVLLRRTVLVTDGYVLDVYDAVSSEPRQYDWIIHVNGQLAGYADGFEPVDRVLGDTDGSQFVTIQYAYADVSGPLVTRWTHGNRHLDHWFIPADAPVDAMLGRSLWTAQSGQRSVFVARASDKAARFVSLFAPTRSEAKVKEVTWQDSDSRGLRIVHAAGVDSVTLPPVGEAGAITLVRVDDAGEVTDLLMANATAVGHGRVSLTSSQPTSLSAGRVGGTWVLHHEGPAVAELKLSGFGSEPVFAWDRAANVFGSSAAAAEDGIISLLAEDRQTYVLGGPAAASLDLSIEIGSIK